MQGKKGKLKPYCTGTPHIGPQLFGRLAVGRRDLGLGAGGWLESPSTPSLVQMQGGVVKCDVERRFKDRLLPFSPPSIGS